MFTNIIKGKDFSILYLHFSKATKPNIEPTIPSFHQAWNMKTAFCPDFSLLRVIFNETLSQHLSKVSGNF